MLNQLISRQEFRWSIRKKGTRVFNICTRFVVLSGLALALMTGVSSAAFAEPVHGVVVGGTADIQHTPAELQINQTSESVLIEWNTFNIKAGETTHFYQPDSAAVALNRVVKDAQASAIAGNLLANGRVFVINPNGVLIGNGANVDTAGFIASTADIGNDAFMNSTGAYDFNIAGDPNASVENQGLITVADDGMVAMVAPTVRNSGMIEGNLAKINLAAGDTFGVDMYGDGLLYVAVAPPQGATARNILAENSGSIIADGGKVLMTAAAASNMVNAAINNSGVIEARSLINRDGEVILTGAGADVTVSGTIDVSGANGGGSIKIGGDFEGEGALPHAATTTVTSTATLKANAEDNGDGGTIIAWSDLCTVAQGHFYAMGGPNGGNGGLIETSSPVGFPDAAGIIINTSAPLGNYGIWMIDPTTLTINAALAAAINAAISNVVLTTSDGLIIAADIAMQPQLVSLTLNAGNGGISGANNFIRTLGGDVTFYTTGAINLNKFIIYTHGGGSAGGNVSLTGDTISINNNAAIGTGGGATAGDVFLYATATNGQKTVSINNSRIDTTGDFSTGGINLVDLSDTPFVTGTDADKADFFGNIANNFDSSKPGGTLTIKGVDVGGNSNCFNAGGTLPCGVVNDPIPPIELDVFADTQSKVYGAADPLFTYVFTGSLQSGDSFTGDLARAPGEDVIAPPGYFINQGALTVSSGFYSYTINYTGNFLTITPYLLSVLADAQGKVYGSADPALTYTHGTLQNEDTESVFSGGLDRDPGETVAGGPYAINQGTLAAGSNYTIDYTGNFLTIALAPPSATPLSVPFLEIDPLGRPIISVADQTIVYSPLFEPTLAFAPIEILTIDTNVSIAAAALAGIAPAGGGEPSAEDLAGVEPAAGGEGKPVVMDVQELANIEPAAGGAVGNDLACANRFLDNRPCPVQ